MAGFLLLAWFSRLPCPKSPEESLAEAIDRGQKAPCRWQTKESRSATASSRGFGNDAGVDAVAIPRAVLAMRTTLRARYVFPVAGDPIPDGAVSSKGSESSLVVQASRLQPAQKSATWATWPSCRDWSTPTRISTSATCRRRWASGASGWSIGFAASWSSGDSRRRPIGSRWRWGSTRVSAAE